ncbi:MAG: hypothetical protein K9L76_00085 [Candidatus Omnitrophica bacterium]|nr:hypothetical protein [Candidatus Omnitrophota bacterium]
MKPIENISKEKAKEILKALIYQEMVDETNNEWAGREIVADRPLRDEFVEFCGLSEEQYDDLTEDIYEIISEFENNTFWDKFAERVAIIKREEEAEKKGKKLSREESFKKLCKYMDEVNDKLQEVDQVALWKHIAEYFK